MKALIIILAILSTVLLASDSIPTEQKSVSQLLEDYNSTAKKAPSKVEVLENEVRKLQTELRDVRRKYYAAKTELKKHEHESTENTDTYTTEQVQAIITQAENNVYYDSLKYALAERQFVLTLTTIEDVHWIANRVLENDIQRLQSIKGEDDTSHEGEIAEIVQEYKTYFNANRYPQTQQE